MNSPAALADAANSLATLADAANSLAAQGNDTADGAGLVTDVLVDFGLPKQLAGAIGSAVVFVAVLVTFYVASKLLIVPLVDRLLRARGVGDYARKPIRLLSHGSVLFVALALGFSVAGYGNILVALTTIAAAATLAIGFALKNVISNFVAGVFIYTDKPFRTGDWIEWDDNSGFVKDISLRVTRVRTFDNEHLTVPNSQLTDDVIKNYDTHGTLRLTFTFPISFEDDIDRATDIILGAAGDTDGVLDDPEPGVKLLEINEASFGLQGRIWIADPGGSDFLGIRGQFVQTVTERFDQEGVTIPYPHRTVEGTLDTPGDDRPEGRSDS